MMKTMIQRALDICELEKIEVTERKAIASLVKNNFPDFRSVITILNSYAVCGRIDEGYLGIYLLLVLFGGAGLYLGF